MRLLALLLALAPAFAARLEPGMETFWDRMMRAQGQRLLRDGALLMDGGRYQRAVRLFAQAVASNPDDEGARTMLGVAYYWSGEVDLAMKEYREALRIDPKDAQAHQLLGIAYAWKGDIDSAYQEFKLSSEGAPRRADVQMNLGSVLEAKGRLSEALDHFRRAVALGPEHPLYHNQLGVLYARLGREAEGRKSLRRSLRLYPAYQDSLLELGALEDQAGRRKEAVSLFRRAVKNKPRDAVARFRLAAAYWKQGLRENSRKVLEDAFHISPLESGGRLALSVAFGGKPEAGGEAKPVEDEPETADPVESFRRNLERLPPDRKARIEVQLVHLPRPELQVRRPKEGERLKRALQGLPNVMAVKREFVLPSDDPKVRAEQIEMAVKDLRKVLDGRPPGQVHLGMNVKYEDTRSHFSEASADPSKVGFRPRQGDNDLGLWVVGTSWVELVREAMTGIPEDARVVRGVGYLTLGEAGRALRVFEEAAAEAPDDVQAWLGVAVSHVVAGREAEAVEGFRRVLKLEPKNAAARDALRWLERK